MSMRISIVKIVCECFFFAMTGKPALELCWYGNDSTLEDPFPLIYKNNRPTFRLEEGWAVSMPS